MVIRAVNATFGKDHQETIGYAATLRANGRKLLQVPTNTVLPGKAKFQVNKKLFFVVFIIFIDFMCFVFLQ